MKMKNSIIIRGRLLIRMKKITVFIIAILFLVLLFTSCMNGSKTLLHTLNLKIPGLVDTFELAPFATSTAEASISSVLNGFEFITDAGTSMKLTHATDVTLRYEDIKKALEVDLEELKNEASISSISTDISVNFSDELGDFDLPTLSTSFTLPNFDMEATSLSEKFEKPDVSAEIASETITVSKFYVATQTADSSVEINL